MDVTGRTPHEAFLQLLSRLCPISSSRQESRQGLCSALEAQHWDLKIPKDQRGPDVRIRLPNALPDFHPDELEIPAQLEQALLVIRNYCRERKYVKAAHHGELAMEFQADCYKVYGHRMNHSYDGVRRITERIVSIVMCLAEIEPVFTKSKAVDRYCTYTLRMTNLHFLLPTRAGRTLARPRHCQNAPPAW